MSESRARSDVVVLGAGPAGLAVAAAAAERGCEVLVVAPEPDAAWRQRYGLWVDEATSTPAAGCFEAIYSAPLVWLDGARRVDLGQGYGTLSTVRLQARMRASCEAADVRFWRGRARRVAPFGRGTWVTLDDGSAVTARAVVDASGASSTLVARTDTRPVTFQAAYGLLLEVDEHGYEPGTMCLMDFRGPATPDPSFLYALPIGHHRVFVEETSLVRRPAFSLEALRARLERRIAALGLQIRRVIEHERCLIPMGLPIPRRDQPIIAFGAAGGMVHPATGYQLGRALGLAPGLAEVIATGLESSPRETARSAYELLWPDSRLRAWELYRFGMEVLAELDLQQLRAFMASFFELPSATWLGFMRGTLTPPEIVVAMAQVFAATPALRLELVGASVGRGSNALLRAALPGNPL